MTKEFFLKRMDSCDKVADNLRNLAANNTCLDAREFFLAKAKEFDDEAMYYYELSKEQRKL